MNKMAMGNIVGKRTKQVTKVNGKKESNGASENSNGKMETSTKVSGRTMPNMELGCRVKNIELSISMFLRFTYQHGGKYIGSYENNQRSGNGTFYWPDGGNYIFPTAAYSKFPDYFIGKWKEGLRTGKGKLFKVKRGEVVEQSWNEISCANYSKNLPPKGNDDF
jgi:hypothetical protein